MIALHVNLRVRPERRADFLSAITENAERTFTDEPGCLHFDVTQDPDDPLHFTFYELYRDEAALDAHRGAAHFAVWRAAADQCVEPGTQVNTVTEVLIQHTGLDPAAAPRRSAP